MGPVAPKRQGRRRDGDCDPGRATGPVRQGHRRGDHPGVRFGHVSGNLEADEPPRRRPAHVLSAGLRRSGADDRLPAGARAGRGASDRAANAGGAVGLWRADRGHPQRLHQEAAILAAKADLQEELDRLEVHVAAARELLNGEGPVGRRLDFLAQEFNRECNTICSKSNAAAVTTLGLDMKIVIDQFREQIQNME